MSGDEQGHTGEAPFEAHLLPPSLSTPHLIVEVTLNHSTRGMHCRCGAAIGDNVDRYWHVANQITEALRFRGRLVEVAP